MLITIKAAGTPMAKLFFHPPHLLAELKPNKFGSRTTASNPALVAFLKKSLKVFVPKTFILRYFINLLAAAIAIAE